MAFSSIPVYHLDPTIDPNNNWPPPPPPPQSNQYPGSVGGETIPGGHLQPPPPPAGAGTGSVRPNSMADRARLAKIPQPEAGLKCPRCESTNTKFCYFNNYSLSQPRHFCKTCRRYWTRGGALRNVPVGGSCRRNKRTKGGRGRSKSPMAERGGAAAASSSNTTAAPLVGDILGHLVPQLAQVPLLPPLHNLNNYALADAGAGLGLDFQVGMGDNSQWRTHQMPQLPTFFANTLEGQGFGQLLLNNKPLYSSPSTVPDPMSAVKSEGLNNNRDLNLPSRNNYPSGVEQYGTWAGNVNWSSDLSRGGFSSAPTGNLA
ncbi:hypothetical protein MLD38_018942 [Melastoma candidum]|uniref:Uncharacterized protein n=1 Tax=Melastoma candidum TaxID=119954 RepID=A0ACB9QUK9_9MYRT|nr:hypothetical protein MLD38_018942 [Melastoma candidum]